MSKTLIMGMLAETFIHPGTGQSAGALDQPVAREAATDYPFIAGSSLKGALKDKLAQMPTQNGERQFSDDELEKLFGKTDNAGEIIVSDARLLLLPVRSLTSTYKWVTCPHLLERLQRDQRRCGSTAVKGFVLPKAVSEKNALGGETGKIMLEERTFDFQGPAGPDVVQQLGELIAPESARARVKDQLVILSNNAFSWFAKFGLAIQARNQLTKNKTSNNLWYEETLPPDTLMYTLISERSRVKETVPAEPASETAREARGAVTQIKAVFGKSPYFQVGGNETVSQGWFIVKS